MVSALDCSVPRFFRELFPIGFGVNREAEAGCCGVILSILAVEVFPPWGAAFLEVKSGEFYRNAALIWRRHSKVRWRPCCLVKGRTDWSWW